MKIITIEEELNDELIRSVDFVVGDKCTIFDELVEMVKKSQLQNETCGKLNNSESTQGEA